jgi:hypothetical protein
MSMAEARDKDFAVQVLKRQKAVCERSIKMGVAFGSRYTDALRCGDWLSLCKRDLAEIDGAISRLQLGGVDG